MTSVGKDHDGKAGQKLLQTAPSDCFDGASIWYCITLRKMAQNEQYEICNGRQSNDAGVFEGVQSAEK